MSLLISLCRHSRTSRAVSSAARIGSRQSRKLDLLASNGRNRRYLANGVKSKAEIPASTTEVARADDISAQYTVDGVNYTDLVVTKEVGVSKTSDLKYLREEHLVKAGIPVVAAAKIIARQAADTPPPSAPQPRIFTPDQALFNIADKSYQRGMRTPSEIFVSSCLGGIFLGFGGSMFAMIAGGSPAFAAALPGLHAVASAAVFPIGLSLIVFTSTDLLTGNFMYATLPFLTHRRPEEERHHVPNLAKVWGTSFAGNLVGSACIAYGVSSIFINPVYAPWLAAIAAKKCTISFPVAVAKGIGANWLVNLGIYMGNMANSPAGRFMGIWLPIWTFVSLGFEHSVANMFTVPLAMFTGATDHTVSQFFFNNLIPVMTGNAIGGAFFVGGLHWYLNRAPIAKLKALADKKK